MPITAARRPPRTQELVLALGDRIRAGSVAPGARLPTEAAVMAEFGVSRTVVREALSQLQAAGLVHTRHGIGTFASAGGDSAFRIAPERYATLQDVIAVLELRIGVESEAAALAAQRRGRDDVAGLRDALAAIAAAVEAGEDAVMPDYDFHLRIARATRNGHFVDLFASFGPKVIPRARLGAEDADQASRLQYLRRVNAEHESILAAIVGRDADAARAAMRTHLVNSRERRRRAAVVR